MAHCSPLGELATIVAKVENIDEVAVAAKLERVFGENHAASDGDKHLASSGTGDTLREGVSDNENLGTHYFGRRPPPSVKLRKGKRKVTSRMTKLTHQEPKL
jgi:hypothetical protein